MIKKEKPKITQEEIDRLMEEFLSCTLISKQEILWHVLIQRL